jgi:hypothetical protein
MPRKLMPAPHLPFRPIGLLAALLAMPFFSGCFQTEVPPTQPFGESPQAPVLHYRLGMVHAPHPAFMVYIDVLAWPEASPKVFLAPAYETDNPDWPVPSLRPAQAFALNARGDTLSFQSAGSRWLFHPSTSQIRYRIDLDTLAPGRAGLAMPNLKPNHHMIDGATLFLIPAPGYSAILGMQVGIRLANLPGASNALNPFDPAQIWRSPATLRLTSEAPTGFSLFGLARDETLTSSYALMFIRGVLAPASRLRHIQFAVPLTGRSLPVTLYALTSDTVNLQTLAGHMPAYLRAVENMLGPLPTDFLAIGEANTLGGLEGMHGYWFGKAYAENHELHLHELIHHYVGISVGDFDLPWFKEGVTTYLAQKLAVQMGYISEEAWHASVLAIAADTTGPIMTVSHGDVASRPQYFRPLDIDYLGGVEHGWQVLVYLKGLQTALLLDAWLLQQSQAEHDLATLVRSLHARTQATGQAGFSRTEFTSLMAELAGIPRDSAASYASQLFDSTGPWPRETLSAALAVLATLQP